MGELKRLKCVVVHRETTAESHAAIIGFACMLILINSFTRSPTDIKYDFVVVLILTRGLDFSMKSLPGNARHFHITF